MTDNCQPVAHLGQEWLTRIQQPASRNTVHQTVLPWDVPNATSASLLRPLQRLCELWGVTNRYERLKQSCRPVSAHSNQVESGPACHASQCHQGACNSSYPDCARRIERVRSRADPMLNAKNLGCTHAFINAIVVSSMRFEKPHSLSYQEHTLTRVPSVTRVMPASTVDDAAA